MDAIFQHIRDNIVAYSFVFVCLAPLLYAFRKVTGPLIFHSLEVVLYAFGFHLFFGGSVRFTSWFRQESAMYNEVTKPLTTPMDHFWDRSLYNPVALYWVEVAALLLIIYIVIKYRPMRFGARNRYQGKEKAQAKRQGRGARRPRINRSRQLSQRTQTRRR